MDTELISENELDDRLHRCDPVNRAAIGSESFRAAVANMQRNIESGARREAPSRLAERPVYRRRWVTLGAATAAVAAVSLVGVETLTGGSGGAGLPLAVPPAAAAQLNQVAHAAAGQATLGAGQWEYLAVKVENTTSISDSLSSSGNATVAYTDTATEQDWIAPDGDVRQRDTMDSFSFLTPQDQATYLANRSAFDSTYLGHGPMVTGVIEDKLFPGQDNQQPGWETSPPSDPHTLINELWSQIVSVQPPLPPGHATHPAAQLAAVAAQRPAQLWGDLSEILLSSTSAQLRATAYAALSYVPGTHVLGNETDQLGRSGIAISWNGQGPGNDTTIIVSPSTGDLLEEDIASTSAADGIPAGTVVMRKIFLDRAVVDSDTALPGGGSQPLAPASQTPTTTASQTTATTAPQATTTARQG